MACRQFFPCRLPNGSTLTRYIGAAGEGHAWLSSAPIGSTTRWAGTWTNFIFQHVSAPGSGKSFTYTLVKNGVDTSVVITIADLATEGRATDQVSASSGDTFYWRRDTSGTPTLSHVRYISEFAHTADNVNGHHGYDDGLSSGVAAPLFNPSFWTTAVNINNNSVVAAPGDLTELHYQVAAAPGAGKSYTFTLYIDDVAQDGAGGTTDTRVTIADAATSGTWTGTLALTVGKFCTLRLASSGSPNNADTTVSVSFAPSVDGESNLSGRLGQNLATSGTEYYVPANDGIASSATESNCDVIGGVSPFVLRDFRIRINLTVGTGPITFTTRKNGAGSGQSVTLTTGQQAGSDLTNEVTIEDGDTWSLEYVATGSPGIARVQSQAWVLYALAAPPTKRVFIFGQGGTTTSTPTVLFNLDGVTRTVDLPQSHAIGGNVALIEQSAAPTGTANTAKLYAIDNGSGKTQLVVIFGSGAAQVIATEP